MTHPDRPRARRRPRLLDVPLQLSIPLSMCAVLSLLVLVFIGAIAWLERDAIGHGSRALQRQGLVVTIVFLIVALAATMAVGVLVTQRIAGPVRVITAAVSGMRAGDYERRLTLRSRDHLAELAHELEVFREELRRRQESRSEILDELERAILGGDLEASLELVRRLHGDSKSGQEGGTSVGTTEIAA